MDLDASGTESLDHSSDAYYSNASYLPSLSYEDINERSLLAPHSDPTTRPITYGQLIDYLKMLSVPILERSDVVLGRKIGVGRSFFVQEGRMQDAFPHISVVAVKTSVQSVHLAEYRSSLIKEVIDEIRVMSHLARHRNVANLIGVILERTGGSGDDGGPFLPRLIVERAVGSLAGLLTDYRHSGRLPWGLKLKLCLDTAAGLEALHLVNIVHGDVKADNILIFDNLGNGVFIAKVSDFGFCVPDTSWRDSVVAMRGTLRFLAPETLPEAPSRLQIHGNLPERDIYSFGVLLWEVITHCHHPFQGIADNDLADLKLSSIEGAADHLITSLGSNYQVPSEFIKAFTLTIHGTVRREPVGAGGRLTWQGVFDLLCNVVNDEVTAYFESRWKDFKDYTQRQPEMTYRSYRDFPWLPTIPVPSTTWSKTDLNHSKVMLDELHGLTTYGDWVANIRLALHFFCTGDASNMNRHLEGFASNSPPDLGKYGFGLLHLAIEVDATPVILSLLQKGVSLNERMPQGRSLLHTLSSKTAAAALISHGADVNNRDFSGSTPLHCALTGKIAKVLLDNGADVHAQDTSGRTPLHTAHSADVVDVLLHYKADTMYRDRLHLTPLHRASLDDVALKIMSAFPETVLTKDNVGNTPLHMNIGKWQASTIEQALRLGANLNERNESGLVALIWDPRALFGLTPEVVLVLIKYGANLNVTGYLGWTPLHFIISYEVMTLFVDNGCNSQVNHPDGRGNTPLHAVCDRDTTLKEVSATSQHSPVLKLKWQQRLLSQFVDTLGLLDVLLAKGADPNIPNNDGNTPLHIAVRNTVGFDGPTHGINIALITQLIRAGANVNARNLRQETPLHHVARRESLITLLSNGADPNLVDINGATILHHLIRFTGSRKEMVSDLIKYGANNVDVRDIQGFTPLHAVCGFQSDPMDYGKATPIVEAIAALLEHGADVNARTKTGDTPLHLVSRQWFQREEFKVLLMHGANIDAKNNAGECVLMPWWRYEE